MIECIGKFEIFVDVLFKIVMVFGLNYMVNFDFVLL